MKSHFLDAAVELLGRSGRRGAVRVEGESMRPALASRDIVAVEFGIGRPRLGDLLLFRQADYLVVHRYVGPARGNEAGPRHRTRGDAVNAFDPPVSPGAVVGRACALHDGRGWWDLDRPGARTWARQVALHDLFWAACGMVARKLDRGLARLGVRSLCLPPVVWMDRKSLGLAHRLCFRLYHRPVADPSAFDAMVPDDGGE